uniref:Uncharacterized protein n=1 Tax=Magallana gigas TaxID=29159 RepID=K1PXG7_MAGGI
MEGKLGLSSQGRKSSWFVSGMGVPGGMVVEPDGLAGSQGRGTIAWEGFKSDWNDQLCCLSSPFSPPGCAGEVSEACLSQVGSSHESRDSPGTQGHLSILAGQGYGRGHSGSGVAPDGNLGAGMAQGDSDVLLVPPLAGEMVSHSWSSSGRNVPAEAKCLQYTGSLEWGLFYAKFRTLARYYGWNDDDCLLALSVSMEGPALKYFYILSSWGEKLSFHEMASRIEQRFVKGTLQAVVLLYDPR